MSKIRQTCREVTGSTQAIHMQVMDPGAWDLPLAQAQHGWGTKPLAQTAIEDLNQCNKLISNRCSILFLFVIHKNQDISNTVNVQTVCSVPNPSCVLH